MYWKCVGAIRPGAIMAQCHTVPGAIRPSAILCHTTLAIIGLRLLIFLVMGHTLTA